MIKIKTEIDKKIKNEMTKKAKAIYISLIVIGLAGLLSYICLSMFIDNRYLDFLLVFAIPFAIGFVYLVFLINNQKKNQVFTNTYEFFEDHFMTSTSKNGEVIGTQKVYYKDLKRYKETENYLFLYITRAAAYVVNKNNAKPEEIEKIKELLNQIYKR